jgi:hypothetical protein
MESQPSFVWAGWVTSGELSLFLELVACLRPTLSRRVRPRLDPLHPSSCAIGPNLLSLCCSYSWYVPPLRLFCQIRVIPSTFPSSCQHHRWIYPLISIQFPLLVFGRRLVETDKTSAYKTVGLNIQERCRTIDNNKLYVHEPERPRDSHRERTCWGPMKQTCWSDRPRCSDREQSN